MELDQSYLQQNPSGQVFPLHEPQEPSQDTSRTFNGTFAWFSSTYVSFDLLQTV